METNHQSSEQYPLNTALEEENQIIAEAKQLLYKRMTNRKYDQFTSPGAVRDYLRFHLAERKHEVFYCLFLDSQHRLLDDRELFRGTIDGCSVYPREVVKATLEVNAAAVILAHNHPSGVAEPSIGIGRCSSVGSLCGRRSRCHIVCRTRIDLENCS